MSKETNNQSGIVLILAILMISAVISAAAIFTGLTIRNLQQSRLVDQAIQAHYIAESGAEHALYQVRQREAVVPDKCDQLDSGSSCVESNGFCDGALLGGEVSCITSGSGALAVTDWQNTAEHERTFSFFLERGQNIQIDLFDPFQEIDPLGQLPSGVGRIFVEWGDLDHELDLDYTLLTLTPGQETQEIASDRMPKRNCVFPSPCNFPTSDFEPKPPAGLNVLNSYLLRLKAFEFIDDEAGPIQVSIFEPAGGNQLPIPSRLIITSVGEFGDSQQRIQVRTPTRPPLSGLYDFVLFSEEEVVKN